LKEPGDLFNELSAPDHSMDNTQRGCKKSARKRPDDFLWRSLWIAGTWNRFGSPLRCSGDDRGEAHYAYRTGNLRKPRWLPKRRRATALQRLRQDDWRAGFI